MNYPAVVGAFLAGLMAPSQGQAAALDVESLLRKSSCSKCHAPVKAKLGPSFREIAEKHRTDPEAAGKLFRHLTTNPKVQIDGKEEEHTRLKITDAAEIRRVVQWVLAR